MLELAFLTSDGSYDGVDKRKQRHANALHIVRLTTNGPQGSSFKPSGGP
jgi:hypothetical protein